MGPVIVETVDGVKVYEGPQVVFQWTAAGGLAVYDGADLVADYMPGEIEDVTGPEILPDLDSF